MTMLEETWAVLLLVLCYPLVTLESAATPSASTPVYSWVSLEYDWTNVTARQQYVDSGQFIVENNVITGIKVYRGEVYLTVPRWRRGVPSSLNRVVIKDQRPVLKPFPSWSWHSLGDCRALQYVQSMEVDPNTGLMWIVDTGRVDFMEDSGPAKNLCPPKLVIYDLNHNTMVHSFTFPSDVANASSCFLNDIVLDYVDGRVRYAYVSDARDAKLYVYDYERDAAYFFHHPSMQPLHAGSTSIDGIAMSWDFRYVYYCPLDGKDLYQIPTFVLRERHAAFSRHVRRVGTRAERADGLAYGRSSLFYGLIDSSGLQRWSVGADAARSPEGYGDVSMTSVETVVQDDVRMKWPDTLAWDEEGYLWFTANDLARFVPRTMDFTGRSGPNMYVWKVWVNETSYLAGAASRNVTSGQLIG